VVLNTKLPLEFFEARNALRIAESEGAATYASDSYERAVKLMDKVDGYATSKHTDRKVLIAAARETVQTAEDSRAIAVKNTNDEHLANERRASAREQSRLQDQADDANQQKKQAIDDTANAQAAKERAEADTARAQNAKTQAVSDMVNAQNAKDQAESDAAKAKSDMADNQVASAHALAAAQIESEKSRMAAEEANKNAQRAETEKSAMRAQLSEQLNKVLQTRETARGLVVSMSDVLFDTGKYSLKPGAREKLAKVAGILLAYPGLNIEVGGYTDSVGGDAMNQTLSENRAGSVRDYLVEQGVAMTSVRAVGYGNTSPVATNANSAGRQQNRRVELLVSGEAIGGPVNATTGSLQ
jgi:outer membrane protein OmpA-like peptidoglycan-associated protein